MKIKGDTIFFKSANGYFQKEIIGLKPNTVRVVDNNLDLSDVKYIHMTNKESENHFTREICDISYIGDLLRKDIIVISWVHPTPEFIKGNLETAVVKCCSRSLLKRIGLI